MTQAVEVAPPIPYWRLCGFYFFYFALLGALVPFWGLYLKDLNYSASEIGVVMAALAGSRIIAPNIWGWLADRSGRRLSIIRLGCLVASISFLGILWRQDFAWLLSIVFLFSFFWNAVLSQFEVLTLNFLAAEPQRYSHIRLWGSIGFIATVVGLGVLFESVSISWLAPIMLAFLVFIWLSSLTIQAPTENELFTSRAYRWRDLLQVLNHRGVQCFFIACLFLQLSHGSYYTFFSVYLEGYGYSRRLIGVLWALGVLAEVVMFVFMHRLLPRFGVRRLLLWVFALAVVRWTVTALLPESKLLLVLVQLLHGFTFGVAHAVAIEWVRSNFPKGLQGQGQALYSALSFGVGGAVGAILSGYSWQLGADTSFLISAAAALIGLIVTYVGVTEYKSAKIGT